MWATEQVSVWAADLAYDWLPPVCWRTGRPADGRLPVTFRYVPRWVVILILFGIVPFLIARHFAAVSVSGVLPMHSDALRDLRIARRAPLALIIAALGALVGALAAESYAVLAIAGFLVVAAMVVATLLNLRLMVRGELVADDSIPARFVVLRNVHPDFAAAVRENYRNRSRHAGELTPATFALNVGPPQPG